MKKFLILILLLFIPNISNASISVDAFVTNDDVTIDHLEQFRTRVVNAINSADGSLIQDGTITVDALDDNANPVLRWDETFSDFIFRGLTVDSSNTLTTTIQDGIAYISGTRVVKDDTIHTFGASKWTFIDLSNNGTFTFTERSIGSDDPVIAASSIRIARVSTDATSILQVRDDRNTTPLTTAGINSTTATAGRILVADGNSFQSVIMTGDCTIDGAGAIDCPSGSPTTLGDLTDVNSSTATAGNILIGDGTEFESDVLNLNLLTDVNTSTATAGNVLIADGTDWESKAVSGSCTITAAGVISCSGGGLSLTSTTTASNATTTGNISISENKVYKFEVFATDFSNGGSATWGFGMRMNGETTSSYAYSKVVDGLGGSTNNTTSEVAENGATSIVIVDADTGAAGTQTKIKGVGTINTMKNAANSRFYMDGEFFFDDTQRPSNIEVFGVFEAATAPTSFSFISEETMDITVRLYELSQ